MSRGSELAKNTAILTFGKICTQFISFLLLPLYTAILEPEVYGISDLLNSYVYLIIPLISLMIDQGLFRFLIDCRDNKERQSTLLSTILRTNVIEALIYIAFYACFQGFIKSQYKLFLLVDVVITLFMNTFFQFARGIGNTKAYALSNFLSAFVTVISNIVLLVVLKIGPWGLFISSILGRLVSVAAAFICVKGWRYIRLNSFDKAEFKAIVKYSLPFIPNQLSWWAIGVSDKTVISFFISIAANGIYSVANKFSSIYIMFYNVFNLSWTESVSLHIDDEDSEDYLSATVNSLFPLFYCVALGIVAFMPFVFPIVINEQYNEAYNQIPILMLAVLFQAVVGLYSVVYVALKKSKEIAKTSFFAAAINIIVNVALIKFIGLYAASISTLVAYTAMTVYRYFNLKKYRNIPLEHKLLYLVIAVAVLVSYYLDIFVLNIVTAVFMLAFSIVFNRKMLLSLLKIITSKFKAIFNK